MATLRGIHESRELPLPTRRTGMRPRPEQKGRKLQCPLALKDVPSACPAPPARCRAVMPCSATALSWLGLYGALVNCCFALASIEAFAKVQASTGTAFFCRSKRTISTDPALKLAERSNAQSHTPPVLHSMVARGPKPKRQEIRVTTC